jgi:hypothetical protein
VIVFVQRPLLLLGGGFLSRWFWLDHHHGRKGTNFGGFRFGFGLLLLL